MPDTAYSAAVFVQGGALYAVSGFHPRRSSRTHGSRREVLVKESVKLDEKFVGAHQFHLIIIENGVIGRNHKRAPFRGDEAVFACLVLRVVFHKGILRDVQIYVSGAVRAEGAPFRGDDVVSV